MKITITLLGILCSSAILFGQRTAGSKEETDREPVEFRDVQTSGPVSEAAVVINVIRAGVNAATKEPNAKPVFTESDYQKLHTKAEEFMLHAKYTDAILLYREILKEREDPFAKDRILEAEALRAKQQQEVEQIKRDAALRAKAESEFSKTNEMCVVHFTGALMSDESSSPEWTSKAMDRSDKHSSFLQIGKYSTLDQVLKKARDFTLDGVAIPANTRLIVYKGQNFTGEVLLDITGPAIVNNYIYLEFGGGYYSVNWKEFIPELQSYFPQSVRSWSTSNMRDWVKGSMEVRVAGVE